MTSPDDSDPLRPAAPRLRSSSPDDSDPLRPAAPRLRSSSPDDSDPLRPAAPRLRSSSPDDSDPLRPAAPRLRSSSPDDSDPPRPAAPRLRSSSPDDSDPLRPAAPRLRSSCREAIADDLARARARTLRLVDLDDAELCRQYDPLMSPLVWDLAHIGQQEELWLLRGGDAARPGMLPPPVEGLYDAFVHSRASRVDLPLLSPDQARAYCRTVRSAVLDALDELPDDPAGDEAAFVYAMVVSHENQHDETMLQALNLRSGAPLLRATSTLPAGRAGVAGTSVLVPAGEFVLGVDAASEPYSLDNERPAHVVDLPAFRIGRVPVTNGEWRQFVDDGGYHQPRWWSERGWQHRQGAGLTAPQFWSSDGLTRTRFGHVEEIPADEPVQHVSYFEAEAYAAWAGARLPTEIEWEKACTWDPSTDTRRRYPWGERTPDDDLANLGGGALRPAPVGAYPAGGSAYGAEQLLGDVWEWTSSPLRPWPGFVPMLYERYSQPFFGGDYRVLRGGSWAVEPGIMRPSFRNWDHPYRRQIFSGVRLAWDVPGAGDSP